MAAVLAAIVLAGCGPAAGAEKAASAVQASAPSGAPTPGLRTGRDPRVLPRSEPVRLRIPSIGVDTALVRLGLDAAGVLEAPADFAVAGWFVHAPTPGELGPAIIAGHVDSKRGPAVFFRLHRLVPGDEIQVERADGRTAVFRVVAVERHPKEAFPTAAVYGDTDRAALRLITCGGAFDRASGHYRENLVAFARLEDPHPIS
jgi:Sortase domain